ncbi:hypothetical protein ACFFWD_07955 [Bradyrhizobium erythrophlei]|uniref:hypothetical protein n=1 Tax=Bradyrhizobium erythrophlei TaxID=1437360 RepID=UPI0035EAAE15
MIDIYGFLSRLFEMQQLMQPKKWYFNVALKAQLAPMNESRDNVIYVDFKAIREAKEAACDRRS